MIATVYSTVETLTTLVAYLGKIGTSVIAAPCNNIPEIKQGGVLLHLQFV